MSSSRSKQPSKKTVLSNSYVIQCEIQSTKIDSKLVTIAYYILTPLGNNDEQFAVLTVILNCTQ